MLQIQKKSLQQKTKEINTKLYKFCAQGMKMMEHKKQKNTSNSRIRAKKNFTIQVYLSEAKLLP